MKYVNRSFTLPVNDTKGSDSQVRWDLAFLEDKEFEFTYKCSKEAYLAFNKV